MLHIGYVGNTIESTTCEGVFTLYVNQKDMMKIIWILISGILISFSSLFILLKSISNKWIIPVLLILIVLVIKVPWSIIPMCIIPLFIMFWSFGNWRVTLARLADSYIYGIENEKLSHKEAFLKTILLRQEQHTNRQFDIAALWVLLDKGYYDELSVYCDKYGIDSKSNLVQKQLSEWDQKYANIKGTLYETGNIVTNYYNEAQKWFGNSKPISNNIINNNPIFEKGNYSLMELQIAGLFMYHQKIIENHSKQYIEKMIYDYFGSKYRDYLWRYNKYKYLKDINV